MVVSARKTPAPMPVKTAALAGTFPVVFRRSGYASPGACNSGEPTGAVRRRRAVRAARYRSAWDGGLPGTSEGLDGQRWPPGGGDKGVARPRPAVGGERSVRRTPGWLGGPSGRTRRRCARPCQRPVHRQHHLPLLVRLRPLARCDDPHAVLQTSDGGKGKTRASVPEGQRQDDCRALGTNPYSRTGDSCTAVFTASTLASDSRVAR